MRPSFDESMQYAMLDNENSISFRIYLRCFLFTNYCYLDSFLVSNFTKKQFIFLLSHEPLKNIVFSFPELHHGEIISYGWEKKNLAPLFASLTAGSLAEP